MSIQDELQTFHENIASYFLLCQFFLAKVRLHKEACIVFNLEIYFARLHIEQGMIQ
jgi:hypothetical protein